MCPSVDFVGKWRRWFAISAVLLAFGLLAIAIGRLEFGIDFQGGAQFTATGAERGLEAGEGAGAPRARAAARLDSGRASQGGAQFTATGAERELDEDEVTDVLPPGIAEESVGTPLGADGGAGGGRRAGEGGA